MSVAFLQRRLVKLQNFVLRLLDDKPLTSNINALHLRPFDSSVYSKWNDQWLKSVFHLSDFNPFHLNTKFCRRFEAQQRRRRNHGHRQGLSLWLREEELLEKIHASKLCNYSSWGSIGDLSYSANKQWKNQICWNVLWIKRLNLSLWGRRKCFYLTRSACWERHGYVLWGCGGIMEGTMEGMLMTHEHPKYCGQWRWSKRIQMILKIQTVQISQMKWNEWFHHDHSIITTSWLNSCWF